MICDSSVREILLLLLNLMAITSVGELLAAATDVPEAYQSKIFVTKACMAIDCNFSSLSGSTDIGCFRHIANLRHHLLFH
jgi:hypothetical protein